MVKIRILHATTFDVLGIVDEYESFICSLRYREAGDFELQVPAWRLYGFLAVDNYLEVTGFGDRPQLFIIENIDINSTDSSVEYSGLVTATLTGRSVIALLDRRIAWGIWDLSGTIEDTLHTLLSRNVLSENTVERRRIANMAFQYSGNSEIEALTRDVQVSYNSLYAHMSSLCEQFDVGMRCEFDPQTKTLAVGLYKGTDRTVASVSPILFSSALGNVTSEGYSYSGAFNGLGVLVGGQGEGSDRIMATVYDDGAGILRREMFVDARNVSMQTNSGVIPYDQYINLLIEEGLAKVTESRSEGEVVATMIETTALRFGDKFFLGDLVSLDVISGERRTALVSEFLYSNSRSGESRQPTFEILEKV